MMGRFGFVAVLLSALAAAPNAHAQTPAAAIGVWLTQAGDAKVKVAKCGAALCGTVVWLKEPVDRATGKPAIDDKNPDPARATRPVIGLQIFGDMRPVAPGKWSGHIYNADDGKTYESSISAIDAGTLKVEGCVGALCGGEAWTRAGK
ncbi:DUF2147 domain-containing protein [Rhodopseudomonas palustris]|uniref:DUF2147 domain-containing protein n=1 Tax=Rhodopseudomonas palustris (strain BisB18) TaxID=316056 RepID=Q210B1_RHOPB